jgi:hypothetical protein
MSDFFDYDPYADQFGMPPSPDGFYSGQYMTDPYQAQAMLQYLLGMDKRGLAQTRSALTGVGTQLSNEGKLLTNRGKEQSYQKSLLQMAMNPAIGQLSGGFDPMAFAPEQQMMPFDATYSPLREQWGQVSTPTGDAINALFDQIDSGADPMSLVSQATAGVGGAMDVPIGQVGMTGEQLLRQAQDYFEESRNRQTAAAEAQYQQQSGVGNPAAMKGLDPSLGSFIEPMINPAMADSIVGDAWDQRQASEAEAAQARQAYFQQNPGARPQVDPSRFVADATTRMPNGLTPQEHFASAGNQAGPGARDLARGAVGYLGDRFENPVASLAGGLPGPAGALARFIGKATSGPAGALHWAEDRIGGDKSKKKPVSKTPQGQSTIEKSIAAKKKQPKQPTRQEREKQVEHERGRLTSYEDQERQKRGLAPRNTGKSVGQANLEARMRFLGQPYPG